MLSFPLALQLEGCFHPLFCSGKLCTNLFFSFLEEKEREESLVPTGIKALSCHASSTDSDIKLNLSLMEIVFPISTMQSPV